MNLSISLERYGTGLRNSRHLLLTMSPNSLSLLKHPLIKLISKLKSGYNLISLFNQHKDLADPLSDILLGKIKNKINLPFSSLIEYTPEVKKSFKTRIWIKEKKPTSKRVVKDFIVVLHDANKAGKHLDIHIGHQSLVIKVPDDLELKYNKEGILTQNSRDSLLILLKDRINTNSRFVHNWDHSKSMVRETWYNGEIEKGYGSGLTRQIVLVDKAELYHPHLPNQHWYIPSLFPDQGTYIYPVSKEKTPILIWGKLIPRDEPFEDRLHLKLVDTKNLNKISFDKSTVTKKYDGSSTHFTTNGIGFKFFSPRYSKVTGHRIEYTYKVPELVSIGHYSNVKGMGELLFWKYTTFGNITKLIWGRGPEKLCWNYLSSPEIGGVLNSNKVRDRNIFPELRIYRVDSFNQKNTVNLNFFDNRKLQIKLKDDLNNPLIKVVDTSKLKEIKGEEGLVFGSKDLSVNEFYKIKWNGDEYDWKVKSISLSLSEKENIQGTIEFISLQSGKEFKLGPGQLGSWDTNMDIINNKNEYIGKTAKVIGINGHEGRAAKFIEWHQDK